MKSYQDHLKTLIGQKPTSICQRSSAIFPLFFNPKVSMKLLFLNYWKLKRNIDHLLCRLFLRDIHGQLILKKCFFVDEIKAYEINLFNLLGIHYPVTGSLEIQFSSPDNLVFPYPGAVVVYEGKNFSTFVHSAQRIFNEDEKINTDSKIIESGFNIYSNQRVDPFITFINGAKEFSNKKINLTAYNHLQEPLEKEIQITSKPYQTQYLNLTSWPELKEHLKNKAGCLKLKLFQSSAFPRLIVGNYDKKDSSMSITHTYYDLSKSSKKSDYWEVASEKWQPLALMLPLIENEELYTLINFYPIYSPSSFWIDVEIYNLLGHLLIKKDKYLKIEPSSSFKSLDPSSLLKEISLNQKLTIKLIARAENKIPTRIKIGLDVGFKKRGLSCNICTNFYPSNPSIEKKTSAFKWAPMMPFKHQGVIWCHNDAPKCDYKKKATIEYTFYRLEDEKTLSYTCEIEPRGTFVIEHDEKTKAFFKGQTGWCVIKSNNPFITTYYFAQFENKMVGGDHGF